MHSTSEFRQVCGALAVNVLSMCNGLSMSWTSPVEPVLEVENNPIQAQPISKEEFSWATSALYLGSLSGIFIWNHTADRFGRKINGYALSLTQIVGWLGIITATSPLWLTVSRFIMGLGGSGIVTSSQLYINETANASIKGPLCSLLVIATQTGYLFVIILGALLPYAIFNYCCLSVPVVFAVLFYQLPESPLYLLMQGRRDEARKVLLWFNYEDESAADEKMAALCQSIDESVKPASLKELAASRHVFGSSCVAVLFMAGHQLCGYGCISSYSVKIFILSGTPISAYLSSILVCLIQFGTAACSAAYAAKYAPKGPLIMLYSYFGAGLSLASLGLYFYFQNDHRISYFSWLPTLSLIVFIMCFASGIASVAFMLIADMFPARILNNVISVGLTIGVFLAFGTVKIFPWLLNTFGKHGAFWFFSLNNVALALFVLRFVVLKNKFISRPSNEKDKDLVVAGRLGHE